MRRDSLFLEEKSFVSEDETVRTQAACLNRIFRKVCADGLSANAMKELHDDIEVIAGVYHLDVSGAVLLAAILEKSATTHHFSESRSAHKLRKTGQAT